VKCRHPQEWTKEGITGIRKKPEADWGMMGRQIGGRQGTWTN